MYFIKVLYMIYFLPYNILISEHIGYKSHITYADWQQNYQNTIYILNIHLIIMWCEIELKTYHVPVKYSWQITTSYCFEWLPYIPVLKRVYIYIWFCCMVQLVWLYILYHLWFINYITWCKCVWHDRWTFMFFRPCKT